LLSGFTLENVTSQATGTAGGNKTDLTSRRGIALGGGRNTNVLVVTSTEGVLHRVHSHTTNLRPAVTLDSVLVVGNASLEHGLLATSTAGNDADHASAGGRDDLLGAGGELDASDAGFEVVSDDDAVVARGTGKGSTVSGLLLDIAAHSSLRHGAKREDVADDEVGLLTTEDELARVHAVGSYHLGLVLAVVNGVTEADLRKGGATATVVDNVADDTLDVAVTLAVVQRAELGGTDTVLGVGSENTSVTLSLRSDNASHPYLS